MLRSFFLEKNYQSLIINFVVRVIIMQDLLAQIKNLNSYEEKNLFLEKNSKIAEFQKKKHFPDDYHSKLSQQQKFILNSLILLNQHHLIEIPETTTDTFAKLSSFLNRLLTIDIFYQQIGGILGYHQTAIDLINQKEINNAAIENPNFFDIRPKDDKVKKIIKEGLYNLPKIAFIFPLGGAGDRLNLHDEQTKKPLPAAKLNFLGKTLLEIMIDDIEALEYLYFKTYHKKILLPICIMTSDEKNNHEYIKELLEINNYYNRDKNNFFLFKQLSVPMISKEGNWISQSPLNVTLKPAGHGVLWKLMKEKKAFTWLKEKKVANAVVRQINNPIAGCDHNLLSLIGYGCKYKKAFGVASCPRKVNSQEGMNVLKIMKSKDNYEYTISNIEYTDFLKWNIEDKPISQNSDYSKYPANTNILFVNLEEIEKATVKHPFFGMMINMKNKIQNTTAGRLELMMQNISDILTADNISNLKTFLTYNERKKTISCTKKAYVANSKIFETPVGCYYDILKNNHFLFEKYLSFKIPGFFSEKKFIENGPNFIILFHPILGPLYETIAEKIQKGKMSSYSEMQLNIANLKINNLNLDGSMHINTKDNTSFCSLKNVTIRNQGIDKNDLNHYWQNKIQRKEIFSLNLLKNSSFIAENVTITGNFIMQVPANTKIIAFMHKGQIIFHKEKN